MTESEGFVDCGFVVVETYSGGDDRDVAFSISIPGNVTCEYIDAVVS